MVNKELFLDTYNYFDKEVIIEIIDIFINEYAERFDKLQVDINIQDAKALKFDAHSIKGVIANFCAPVAWEKARDLEKIGALLLENSNEFDQSDLTNRITELKECVIIMAGQLAEIKAELAK